MATKLNKIQRLARFLGKDAGPNTWFKGGIRNQDNRNVYVRTKPGKVSRPLATVKASDLPRIIKARVQGRK